MPCTGQEMSQALSLRRLAITVIAPFSCGYFLSYMYRAINAVVAPNLVADLGLSASELGLLTAAYLFAFAGFQIPLGMALDRYGPRRVQTTLLLVAAVGSLGFAVGDGLWTLGFARALIGLGFAGGLMAGFKAVVLWFPYERHALANRNRSQITTALASRSHTHAHTPRHRSRVAMAQIARKSQTPTDRNRSQTRDARQSQTLTDRKPLAPHSRPLFPVRR